MKAYTTTRGATPVGLAEAVFRGLGPDGGLFVPARTIAFEGSPPRSSPDDPRPVAAWAAPFLFPELPPALAEELARGGVDFPMPLVEVEPGIFVLELFHGPTHAFKDVGARFMAGLMAVLDDDSGHQRTILVATSGDTGGAVASAFHGHPRARVLALFPRTGISERQRRQMTTLGDNVHALAVEGTFDDCQRMVKAAFADEELRIRHALTSANSINVARLIPQTLYYLHAAHTLGSETGSAPHFVVPSGNLGNLCAGLIAAKGGMPTSGFTAATNENSGFADFLGGEEFKARPSVRTASNAMDVGAPSNLERIRWLYGGDDEALRRDVSGAWVSDQETSSRIRTVFERTGYIMDPHTAVAYSVASRHHAASPGPVVVLATAHPGKFPDVVEAAIGGEVPQPPGVARNRHRTERMREMNASVDALRLALEELSR